MNSEQICELLSERLDSEEKFDNVKFKISEWFSLPSRPTFTNMLTDEKVYAPWWAWREASRIHFKFYEQSELTKNINQHFPGAYAHVSREDKNYIAYTPDAEAGIRDKQLKIAPGRLLRKLFPLFTDNHINDLVAEHLGEVNAEIELLTSYDDILKAYSTMLDSSCMTVGKVTIDGMHPPSVAYSDNEFLKLAVLRAGDKIVSRTLIRTDTKKYIRIYGNKKLQTALEKDGYTAGNLIGLKLKTQQVRGEPGWYIMPYLDGNGGRGGESVSMVALISDQIYVISAETAARIRYQDSYATQCATNTAGKIRLSNTMQLSDFLVKDAITGEDVNFLTDSNLRMYDVWHNGEAGKTAVDPRDDYVLSYYYKNGRRLQIYAKKADCFEHNAPLGDYYVESEVARTALGYYKLSAEFYPDEQDWCRKHDITSTGDGKYIKNADAVMVITKDQHDQVIGSYVHKSVITKEHIKVHSTKRGQLIYADKSVEIIKTSKGRKVVKGYHDVVFFEDLQQWDFRNKAKSVLGYDKVYFFSTGDLPEKYHRWGEFHIDVIVKELLTTMSENTSTLVRVKYLLGKIYNNTNLYAIGSMSVDPYYVRSTEVAEVALSRLRSNPEEIGNLPVAQKVFIRKLLEAFNNFERQEAEANATEYPNRIGEQPFQEELISTIETSPTLQRIRASVEEAMAEPSPQEIEFFSNDL